MEEKTPKYRKLTLQERLRVADLLKEHYDPAAERFFGGWCDEKIREAANAPSAIAVAKMRRVLYGNMKRAEPKPDGGLLVLLAQRVAALEAQAAATPTQVLPLDFLQVERRVENLATQQANTLAMVQKTSTSVAALVSTVSVLTRRLADRSGDLLSQVDGESI